MKMKLFMFGAAATLMLFSCSKATQLEPSNNETKSLSTMSMMAASDGFNKKYQSVTITIGGTSTTSINCTESGDNCKKTKGGVDVRHLASLSESIGSNSTADFFRGTSWVSLFPELEGTDILTQLQNNELKVIELPQIESDNTIFVVTSVDADPINPNDEQVVFAVAFE